MPDISRPALPRETLQRSRFRRWPLLIASGYVCWADHEDTALLIVAGHQNISPEGGQESETFDRG